MFYIYIYIWFTSSFILIWCMMTVGIIFKIFSFTFQLSLWKSLSHVQLFTTPWTLYSPWNSPGQNTGVGKPFPSPGDLPNPGIELGSPALQADSLTTEISGKPISCYYFLLLLFSYFFIPSTLSDLLFLLFYKSSTVKLTGRWTKIY